MALWSILKPNIWIDKITDLPLDRLKEAGFRALFVDLDNTLTAWNSMEIAADIAHWVKTTKAQEFKIVLLSNNKAPRILPVATALNLPFVAQARKPFGSAFTRGAEITGESMQHTVMIGDQLFTDVWGGKRAGAYTVLVNPLHEREFYGTKISRFFEKIIIKGWGESRFGNKRI